MQVLAIAYLVHADLADRILLVFRERFAWVKRGFGEETLIITFVLSFVLIYKNKQYKYEYEEEGNIIDQLHIMNVCVKTLFFLASNVISFASETISFSDSDFPILCPSLSKKVLAIPPPIIITSTF